MERVVHNPVDLMVEVPRPVVIEKTIEANEILDENPMTSSFPSYWTCCTC